MTYLSRQFSFAADTDLAKKILLEALGEVLSLVNKLPIIPLHKCHALNLQVWAKLTFTFCHYYLCPTLTRLVLDSMVTESVRTWLDLPPSATAHFLCLSRKLLGLDLILPSMLAELCQLGTELTLVHSQDAAMLTMHKLSPRLLQCLGQQLPQENCNCHR